MIEHIILKATGNCNLACSYCYYQSHIIPQWKTKFELPLIEKLFSDLSTYNNSIAISWHGGEPLLNGIEYYFEVIALAKKYKLELHNSLQTNGTLLNDDWAEFFKENNFSIGISLDGMESHNLDRKFKSNASSSYSNTIKGLEILKRHDVKTGVLCVANGDNNGNEVFNHLLKLGVNRMDFLIPLGSTNQTETDKLKLSEFYISIFDSWYDRGKKDIEIRLFMDVLSLIMGGKSGNCIFRNACERFITIEPNGDVGICENVRVNGLDEYLLGMNIWDSSLKEVETQVNIRLKINRELPSACHECIIVDYCNGGCMVGRMNLQDSNVSEFCQLYKDIFTYIILKLKNPLSIDA